MPASDALIALNPDRQRFELVVDGKTSLVEFTKPDAHTLALTHTEVDPALEGQGVGSELVKQVLDYADKHNQKIVPVCPFVDDYIKRHPDWQRVVSTDYNRASFK